MTENMRLAIWMIFILWDLYIILKDAEKDYIE